MGLRAFWKNYKRVNELARQNEELKERAEHAEEMWGLQYKLSTDASYELSLERRNATQAEAGYFRQFHRLLKLIRRQLLRKFGITLNISLEKDGEIFCLKDGLTMTFSPKTIITLFCELLGVDEPAFWENVNPGWKMCLESRIRADHGVPRYDGFAEFPGRRLRADTPCLMDGCKGPGKTK